MGAINWKAGVSGDWSNTADWTGGLLPGSADTVTINAPGTYTATISGIAQASSLTLNDTTATLVDSGTLTLAGPLNIAAGTVNIDTAGSLAFSTPTGSIAIAGGATLHETGTHTLDNVQVAMGTANNTIASLSFDNLTLGSAAVVSFNGGNPAAATSSFEFIQGTNLTNNGTIEALQGYASGLITAMGGTLTNNGSLINASTSGYTVEANDIINNGLISASNGGGIGLTGFNSFVNNGTINDAGGIGLASQGFVNNGTINVTAGYIAFDGPATSAITGNGTINVSGSGNTVEFIQSQTFGQGTINVGGTSQHIAVVSSPTSGLTGGLTYTSAALTLGTGAVIHQTDGSVSFDGIGDPSVTDVLINQGVISAAATGGSMTIATTNFQNDGSVNVTSGDHLLVSTTTTGAGTVSIGSGGIAEFGNSVAATDKVVFSDGQSDLLKLDAASTFAATVSGFQTGNTIDLAGYVATGATWSNGALHVTSASNPALTLNLAGNYAGATFKTVSDGAGGTNITLGQAAPASTLTGSFALSAATEGTATSGPVATFADTNLSETASAFTALINWGDGTTSAGVVSGSNGVFSVAPASGHIYATEGSFAASTAITHVSDGAVLSVSGIVAAAEGDTLTVNAAPNLAAKAGQALTNVTVAAFNDTYTANTASDFSAQITWGDGSTSAGTVSNANGVLSVVGSHTYAAAGTDAVSVTIRDIDGTAVATATGTANITAVPVGVISGSASGTVAEGTSLAGAKIATFHDTDLTTTAASYTANITWADGSKSVGVVSGSVGSFTVAAGTGPTYADESSQAYTVALTRTADGVISTVGGTLAVTEADVLSVKSAAAFTATTGQAFSGTLATFTDSYAGVTASDLAATINWGDSTTSTGVVSITNGVISVAGTHAYTGVGSDTISVKLTDVDGTASATASGSASVSAPSSSGSGSSYNLMTKVDNFTGTAGDDTFVALTNTLSKGDIIDGSAGNDTLLLSGGGTFNLASPTTLTNIEVLQAQEGIGAGAQTVTLRSGLNLTVNVASSSASGAGITIIGANDASIIKLGTGNDTVTLGSVNETVIGGGGNDIFNVKATTIGATIDGGTGVSKLVVSGGGTEVMGSNITHIASVDLASAGSAYNFTANAISGLVINDLSAGNNDKIHAGAAGQTLTGGTGDQTFFGFGSGVTTYVDSAKSFNGSTIQNFNTNDVIDISGLALAANTKVSFSSSGASAGDLNIYANGVFQTQIHLVGQIVGSAFNAISDGHGGTLIVDAPLH